MKLSKRMEACQTNWNILQWYISRPQKDMLDRWAVEVAEMESRNTVLIDTLELIAKSQGDDARKIANKAIAEAKEKR